MHFFFVFSHFILADDVMLGTDWALVLKLSVDAGWLTPVAREPMLLLVMLIIGVK